MGGGNVIEIASTSDFEKHLKDATAAGKVVIVDFSAVWCGPCQMIGPYFGQLSQQYPNAVFLKVDVDSNGDVAQKYNVSAMPTFIVIKGGEQVDMMVGASKDKLKALVEKFTT